LISVVIPVYNEADAVRATLEEVLAELKSRDVDSEVIVVDDGSTDSSAEIVEEMEDASLIRHHRNRGYGAAIKTGVRKARGDVVVTFDADGQHDPKDVWKLVDALEPGAFVIGDRGKKHHSPLWRGPGKWLLARLVNLLARERVPDFNSGLRAAWREDFLAVEHLCADRFSFSASSTLAFRGLEIRLASVPIEVRPRKGRSSMRLAAAFDSLIAILRISMMFDPLRIFMPLSALAGAVGFAWLVQGLFFGSEKPNISDVCVLLLLTSLQLFLLGLVADQIAQVRRDQRRS